MTIRILLQSTIAPTADDRSIAPGDGMLRVTDARDATLGCALDAALWLARRPAD